MSACNAVLQKTNVVRFENKIFSSNTYFCKTSVNGQCVVIDPGLDGERIEKNLEDLSLTPVAVFCTHGHFDHVGSASRLQRKYQIPIYVPAQDMKLVKASNFLLMACKIDARIVIPTVDHQVGSGEKFQIGDDQIQFIHVPGHTPGSSFIQIGDALFTGDSLYRNAVGLVDFPGEDPEELKASLLAVWDQLPDELQVYPGHGGSGRFGDIKLNNQRLRQFLGIDAGAQSSDPSEAKVGRLIGQKAREKFEGEL